MFNKPIFQLSNHIFLVKRLETFTKDFGNILKQTMINSLELVSLFYLWKFPSEATTYVFT